MSSLFKEYNVKFKRVDRKTLYFLNDFILLSKLLYSISSGNINENNFNSIKNEISKYKKYKFITPILTQISQISSSLKKGSSTNIDNLILKVIKTKNEIEKNIISLNFNSIKNLSTEEDYNKISNYFKSGDDIISSKLKINILKSSFSDLFSGGKKKGFLSSFDKDDWNSLNKHTFINNITYFSYLSPPTNASTFDYIVYYITKIKTDKNSIELEKDEFIDYINSLYNNNKKYLKFKSLVDDYLFSNKKNLILKILNFLDEFPIIKKENEKRKKLIKTVYRGISFEERDELYNKLLDKKQVDFEFAATSMDKNSALNFAFKRGHLDSLTYRGNNFGLLITYEVNKNSILIDFSVLGGVFGEDEVLINTKKSKIKRVEQV
jgi:hypothetical protein